MDNDKRGRSPEVVARRASEQVIAGRVNHDKPGEAARLLEALLNDPDPGRYRDQRVQLEVEKRLGKITLR